jgi:hypothetical protein
MDFIKSLFYSTWIRVGVYIVIGIGVNTASPHYPTFSGNFGAGQELHSLTQYVISVGLWPLSLWHPEFTVGKWTGL